MKVHYLAHNFMKLLRHLVQLGVTPDMTITDAKHVRFTNITALITSGMTLPWAKDHTWDD